MAELYEVVNKIIENDLNDEPAEQEEVAEEREAQDTREQEDTSEDTGYDNRGIDGTMSNSIGRGAVENFIKNSVYEKYNIDPQKMKDFSKLSPTEMISDFGSSVKELGQLRSDYEAGKYTKSEYKVLSSKVKGEISGKMLEMGSCRKSILEDVLLRSFGVSPAEVSNVRSFNDLVEVFKPDQEPSPDTERNMRIDNDLENQVDADPTDAESMAERDAENPDAQEIEQEAEAAAEADKEATEQDEKELENDNEDENEADNEDAKEESESDEELLYGKEYGSGKCYYCIKCGAHVGTHVPRHDEAYGLLSNKTMQMYRRKCHRLFDNLWKGAKNERKMRTCLYGWLAAKMGVDTSDSHFGYFDLEQLREAERILTLVQDKRPVISKKGRLRFEG